jgi:DNA-binding transcriptional LysR family regulator
MDFEQLRTFLEVSQHKSFSRAAGKLLVTQPAISAQIRSLEQEVGAQLFDRVGGKVSFTAAGRVFEPFAEHCLKCYSHILLTIGQLQLQPRGEVSIGANEGTCLYVLPEVIAAFKQQYSRVALNIVRGERMRTIEAVLNSEIDFGVITLPVKDPRLTIEVIHKDELMLVMPPKHPLAKVERVRITDLSKYPLLLPKQGRQREQIEHLFVVRGMQPKVAMELDSSELVKRFASAGLGIGFLPKINVKTEEKSGELVVREVEGAKLRRTLALIYRTDHTVSRAAQAFQEIATGRVQQTEQTAPAVAT